MRWQRAPEEIMQSSNFVVARYRDGHIVRGTTADLSLLRSQFHVVQQGQTTSTTVFCTELKAVFFVRSLTGHPERNGLRGFLAGPSQTTSGIKLAAKFPDGELLCGYAQGWSADRDRFFLFPADTNSNNLRVLVFQAATVQIASGTAADALVLAEIQQLPKC
jgi:hypothetical protein